MLHSVLANSDIAPTACGHDDVGDDGWGSYLQVLGRAGDSVGSGQRLGLTEAYLLRQVFFGINRLRVRAGQFFLPVSLEAADPLWSSPYTQHPFASDQLDCGGVSPDRCGCFVAMEPRQRALAGFGRYRVWR